jgi:hypothetical protein
MGYTLRFNLGPMPYLEGGYAYVVAFLRRQVCGQQGVVHAEP